MALPDTRRGLEAIGYRYTGSSPCRYCPEMIHWYETPSNSRMPMSVVDGSSDEEILEPHFNSCPNYPRRKKK